MVNAFRQGDVLIIKIDELPKRNLLKKVEPVSGRVILAEGEVTGHAHALESDGVALLELPQEGQTSRIFMELTKDSTVNHEEHGKIDLTKGFYEIRRQREYQPDEIRQVAD